MNYEKENLEEIIKFKKKYNIDYESFDTKKFMLDAQILVNKKII